MEEDTVTTAQVSQAVSGARVLQKELRVDEGFPQLDRSWLARAHPCCHLAKHSCVLPPQFMTSVGGDALC